MTKLLMNLSICVIIPNVCVKRIKLDPSHQFSIFQRLFPKEEKRIFIFNGSIMNEKSTLIEVGIKDNDSIIALPYEKDNYSENTI